ncbi:MULTISPECIES: PP2C family serine/threonine-protein phosphatase [Brevibacillus]|uniref:PPM-type phosphatase domain-containing protein n=1 Tax=Brevibacillus brevis (strain 47 / JCM 6285 / NBRC 100599) TaxID=358681 RepID=C0ZJ79_BREBN|nr:MULTISPECIES: protein phosphatase 2C domain-containing protein [Bacillales]MBH0331122.1 serine/threonine protein phosphatase [Brevibacillus brevis]NRR04872.1 serine/threonine-protein phosphatase [Brevibacillus sp. RS1.1]NRS51224.1 serine/threonine-protein phosphatase [Brevibacillus sp. HB2.2]TQR30416.1 serine/threonine-protein phosphatase [Lysinibacillus sp. SDF0063]UIO41298.1 protein phosphatase 2C domain-containing protein [Brevibacillus brevis]
MFQQGAIPYLVVLGVIIAITLLFRLRAALIREEMNPVIQIGNGQTIGRREEQDDYFSTATSSHGTIAVLADGISGLANGRLASTLAVTTFIREFTKLDNPKHISLFFSRAAFLANSEILQALRGSRGGTTLVAGVIVEDKLYWGAVGDSIITVFRNGEFIPINQKDIYESVLEARFLSGEITKDEALEHPQKKQLINYLGYDNFQNIEIGREPFPLEKGDKVILCSDGVYDTLTEMELEQILFQNIAAHDAADQIIEAVESKQKANQDNATILILEKGW